MRNFVIWSLAFAIVLSWSATAEAWLRWHHEDAAVIGRSEAIVVGRLDKDSIKYVPHDNQIWSQLGIPRDAGRVRNAQGIAQGQTDRHRHQLRTGSPGRRGPETRHRPRVRSTRSADGIDIIDTGNSPNGWSCPGERPKGQPVVPAAPGGQLGTGARQFKNICEALAGGLGRKTRAGSLIRLRTLDCFTCPKSLPIERKNPWTVSRFRCCWACRLPPFSAGRQNRMPTKRKHCRDRTC